jgi:ribosomal protein S15P/S13E
MENLNNNHKTSVIAERELRISAVIASCSRDEIDSLIKQILWEISEIEEHCEDAESKRELYHLEKDYERLLFAYNSL